VETQGEKLIRACREKNVGFIDMKPLAGGAIEDATLALRFICANEDVDVLIPGMAEISELSQNLAACEDTAPLCAEENGKILQIRQDLGTNFCRRCNYCQPCAAGINISGVFLFEGYLSRYGLADWARSRYATLPAKASDCIGCGACEDRCPYHLPIRKLLKTAAEKFGE
jgi:predicted aldo/keto reductase-like oxidoreductase